MIWSVMLGTLVAIYLGLKVGPVTAINVDSQRANSGSEPFIVVMEHKEVKKSC